MVTARFVVQGKEQETREVEEQWLEQAFANQDNVLLSDGNTYRIKQVAYVGAGAARYAHVELVAPQFARAS
jgi:hypothetical protein